MSSRSNGVDWVRSLRKILIRLRGTNFCNKCTTLSPFCTEFHEFHAVMKWSQMHPNTKKRTKTWVLDPMGWIWCICCEKFRCDFMARTFALIAPVQPILHRVLYSKEMIPNPPRHYETHQNMSLGSYGVDRVDLLQKILTWLCGTNFALIAAVRPVLNRVS